MGWRKMLAALCAATWWVSAAGPANSADVTFYSYGDSHYGALDGGATNWVGRINAMAGYTYPTALGGGSVGPARGVVALGDLINDAGNLAKGPAQWALWKADYGVNGEGVCTYPVYECFGNHDLHATRFVQKDIIARNLLRPGLTAISTNGLHYSWDWDGVHFVALGIYPADKWTTENTYSSVHNPESALAFLKWDLANNVGDSGRPVITLHHYDFLTDWWPAWQKLAYPRELDGYNVVLILHGHQGAPYGYNWQGYTVSGQNGSLNAAHITPANEILLATSTGANTWGNTYRKSFVFPDLGRSWNPVPRNGHRNVAADVTQLAWRPGAYAVTQDVYFGTSSNAVAAAATPDIEGLAAGVTNCAIPAAYLPLQPGAEYFWRVDQHNGAQPFSQGRVWSFRTRDTVGPNDLTFLFVSDIHYEDETLTANKRRVQAMNALPGAAYPAGIGGSVETPRGIVFGGDAASDAKQWQYDYYVEDHGLAGEKLLEYPVTAELNGNHDGGLTSIVGAGIVARNRRRSHLTGLSTNGFHCSWNWDGVHCVTLGVRPGANTNPYNSHGSLEFLIEDLAKNVGNSGQAVMLFQHFGVDDYAKSWWTEAERARYYEAIRNYNVIGIFHGHTHTTSIYKWNGIDVYHAPHMEFGGSVAVPVTSKEGFYVVHVTSNRLAVAERKADGTWGLSQSKPIFRSYASSGLAAVVGNGNATNVVAGNATIGGNLLHAVPAGGPTEITLCWGPADGGTNRGAWAHVETLGPRPTGPFAASVSGLSARRTYFYRCYAANALGNDWADTTANFVSGSAADVDNATGATGIAMSTATLNGMLLSTAAAPTTVALYWGPTDGGAAATNWQRVSDLGPRALGAFSAGIAGLSARTRYYYRAYATNSLGAEWAAASASFTTDPSAVVDNGAGATQVTRTGATLNGSLVRTYVEPTAVSLLWGPTDGGAVRQAWSNAVPLGPTAVGAFSAPVPGLASDTRYYYRSYATNAAGDSWADTSASFVTLSARPTIANSAADAIRRDSANLNGLLISTGSAPTHVWVYLGTADGGTNAGVWARNLSPGLRGEGPVTANVTDLVEDQPYYYRYFASNAFGVAWADTTATFRTLAKPGTTYTWDGGGGNTLWNNPVNWVGDAGYPKAAGDTAKFTSYTDYTVFALSEPITLGQIDCTSKLYVDFGVAGETMTFETSGGEAQFNWLPATGSDPRRVNFKANMVLASDLKYHVFYDRHDGGILGTISGPGRLRLQTEYEGGAERWSLGAAGGSANTYAGGTIVMTPRSGYLAGLISVKKNGAFGSGSVTLEPGARVVLEDRGATDDMLPDRAFLRLAHSGATYPRLTLNTGVNETVGGLFFDGARQADGTWGAIGSTAAHQTNLWFAGTGVLTVRAVDEPPVILGCRHLPTAGIELRWNSLDGYVYAIAVARALRTGFLEHAATGIVATPPVNTLTIPVPAHATNRFFRIEASQEP